MVMRDIDVRNGCLILNRTLQHVGKVKFSHFDSRPSKQITYVVSEQGVLAALSSTTTGGPLCTFILFAHCRPTSACFACFSTSKAY